MDWLSQNWIWILLRPGHFDPVSHHLIAPEDKAVSTICHGRAYYFENRKNRDLFEASPGQSVAGPAKTGKLVDAGANEGYRRHRRRGR